MKYRRLGNSGLQVSEISLGTWLTFDGTSTDYDKNDAITTIKFAYENGINYFDTANFYGLGNAEKVLGEALAEFDRTSYVIGSKVYFPMGSKPNQRGLSRKHIMDQCDQSLKRLNVDYIDIYQCHRYDPSTPVEETLTAMNDLVAQGKILYYGISEWSSGQIKEGLDTVKQLGLRKMVSNQPIYNMLVRQIEKDIIPASKEGGLGQLVFSPLAQGVLTGAYTSPDKLPENSRLHKTDNDSASLYFKDEIFEAISKLKIIAERERCSLTQLALSWILLEKNVSSVIMGAENTEQVAENIKASDMVWREDLIKEVNGILDQIDFTWPLFD
ncbi:aldo/keto reductase family protein [Salipaludibacillus aurantiacus]|uniref:Predicted oxidoreductase n=1 Tax=Salipaludibacillus aurantiacus TaxID=1601833 RepID=A0A1H9URK8_9BACI|nr:aldo/keto reductase family protein [Salipaludibacillus aurantiacus]SES11697.1 Predicted oxidoreductase [Salipaludibacillus aurantiacus]